MRAVEAVTAAIFDFGGVMTEPVLRRPRDVDPRLIELAVFFLQEVVSVYPSTAATHDIHLLETGRITEEAFFTRMCERFAAGGREPVPWREARDAVFSRGIVACGAMVDAVREVRAAGYRTALLTNNAREWEEQWRAAIPVDELFDVVVDSSRVGLRKPDPAIYHLTCERLAAQPDECLFVDDLECNVEAAASLGMRTILCADPVAAAGEVLRLLLPGGRATPQTKAS
jgi:putative hydrolase of the HAD superfamily